MRAWKSGGKSIEGDGMGEVTGIGVGKRTLTQGFEGSGKGAKDDSPKDEHQKEGEQEQKEAEQEAKSEAQDAKVQGAQGEGETTDIGDSAKTEAKGEGEGEKKPAPPKVTTETKDAAPGGAPNTRRKVGVGETVTFTSDKGGKWTADQAGGKSAKTATGDKYVWKAMSVAGTAKITLDTGDKGVTPTEIQIEVIAPEVDYLNHRPITFPGAAPGAAGVNMETDVTYLPQDVSFDNTMWWEEPGPGSSPTGYFASSKTRKVSLPFHNPAAKDIPMDKTKYVVTDKAGFWGFTGPFKTADFDGGSFEWVIPTHYKVVGDSTRHKIKDVHQKCEIDGTGTVTVTKESGVETRPITG